MRRRQHTSRAGPPQQPRPQMPTMPGQYSVPAQYGPMSLQGKGTVYSSPQDLRGRMESRIPKNVKYERIGADAESRPRTAMGGALADTFSGNFNVYGGQVMDQEATMRSRDLNERLLWRYRFNKKYNIFIVLNIFRVFECNLFQRTMSNKCYYPKGGFLNSNIKDNPDIAPLPVDLSRQITSLFDLKKRKQERISEYMCRNIRKTKLRALKRMAKTDVASVTRPLTSKEFRAFSENCSITNMSRYQEKCIRSKINSGGLEKTFPRLIDDIIKETKTEFKKITHCAGVNLKIKEKEDDFTIENYKFLGKTQNYDKFLCIRKQFSMRWILHYKIMRMFLRECVLGLPYVLFEIEIPKVLDIEDIQYIFREKINSSAAILHDFHKSISSLFDKIDAIFKKRPSKFLPACTGLFSIYVSRCIAHTIEELVKFTETVDLPPYLKLYVDFEANLILTPTAEQVIEMFDKLLESVICVGMDLNVMEKGHIKGYESKKVCLGLTDEFIEKSKKTIVDNITKLYEPILKYLEILESEFQETYADINSETLSCCIDVLFDDGCKKIQYYKNYIRKVAYIPDNEYFRIGQLDLTNYREKLHDSLQTIADSIFNNLSLQHFWEVNDICDSFLLIQIRATQKPVTTEELIEIGKFMAWVRNEQLESLNQRVIDSLLSLCNIITLGILDEDHMNLNSIAMNWMSNIIPIIEKHSINYEQLKFEAEEKLQKVIEDINVLITDMYPILVILDEMDDIKRARNHLNKITLHMSKIKEKVETSSRRKSTCSVCNDFLLNLNNLADCRFKGTVDDPDILNWPAPLKLCGMSLNILEEFKPSLAVMKIMCNKNLRPRHWNAISEIAGLNLMPNAGTTLKKMMEHDLQKNLEEYEIISTCATKEQQLLDNLNVLKAKWDDIHFVIDKNKDNIWILIQLEEVQTIVDEHMIKILTMRSSVFVKPYETEVSGFYDTILKILSVLNDWNILQNAYLKLFPIFAIEDVIHHVPNEQKHFKNCDLVFLKYTRFIKENSKVIDLVSKTDIVEDLKQSLSILEIVQKGVDAYLEITRLRCPRLYLISNEELINLTASNSDFSDERIFVRIFPGIKRVKFINKHITSIFSASNEEVVLKNPINLSLHKNVDEIVSKLQEEMLFIMKYRTADCYKVFKKTSMKNLLKKYPQQSLQIMARVFWTDQVENALKLSHNIRLLICKSKLEASIEEKIDIINRNQISNLERIVIKNLLLTDLNNQYLLSSFVKDGLVIDDNHFEWQVQLRYYFEKSLCSIKILNHSLDYSYEYLGNTDQLVLTPLTDRCIITLLNAYFFNFYGLLTGDGQTGKSVTLKYLADALGKLFSSFSCISEFTSSALLQLLKGTFLCGSWMCLQNIDQLQVEVLSVISQELLQIIDCKKNRSKEIFFEGIKLPFDQTCFIFVQLSSEAARRVKFPENFKSMFRSFTLCQPDLEVIIQSLLACQGIENYKSFSKIIQECCTLLEDILGFQKHYVFKLREIKQVLRFFEKNKSSDKHFLTILCNSFRNALLPRLLDKDYKIFEDTLSDVFQAYYEPTTHLENKDIEQTLANLNLNRNLYMDNKFINKLMDVYNTMNFNTGRNVILLGDTYTGKTTILKLCAQLFEPLNIKLHIINPKCITHRNLIGETSTNKNVRWSDGILLKILIEAGNDENNLNKYWILFDGYVDEIWTKDFLSVLESGKLFLESLETIMFGERTTLIFETADLDHSSPAMISRCTTIYFPRRLLNDTSLIETWLNTCKSDWLIDHKSQIEALLKWLVPPCLEEIEHLPKYCDIDDNSLTKNAMTYFQLILDDACSKINRKDEDPKNMVSWIHATLIQAGICAFPSVLTHQSRQKFDEFYKQLWKGQIHPYPNCLERLEVSIPTEGFLFDYCYLYKQRGTWKQWSDLLKNEKLIENQYLSSCIVPTVDTMRCNFLLDLHIKYKKQFLINGPKGTGKSIALRDCYINRLPDREFEKGLITINRHLTGNSLQKLLLSKLSKGRSGDYSATSNKRFICFIDDLQYAAKDRNNISSVIELIRQHLDHNLWYDLKTLTNISLEKINFVASVGFAGDKPPPKRFMRHFTVLGVNEFSHESITKIYSQNLMQLWKKSGFPSDMITVVNQIVNASLQTYLHVLQNMKATLNKSHYVFDIFSLSKVIHGCSFLKKETYDSNKKIYIKLWVHEIFRIYSDRLFIEDIRNLTMYLKEAIVEHFSPEELSDIFPNYDDPMPFSKVFFGTFPDKDLDISHRHYDEINFQHLKDLCLQNLQDFNGKYRFKLDLIFFNYSLEKLARICRILSIPNENALLLGVTGCGRQSLVKFASFFYKHDYFQAVITRDYNMKSWASDFKHVLKLCGGLNTKCTFFVSEDQLINENFFEIIDHYIRDGEATDLYDIDEKQDVLELSRLAAQGGNRNLDISTHKVFLYFNKKCRENFHLFLSLNSTTDNLRRRILKYPALVSRLTIIFWKDWPDDALQSVAKYWMKSLDLDADIKEKTISAAIYFHRISQTVKSISVTPKSYIHLNKLFVDLVSKKQNSLTIKMKRFQQGLSKLSYAATQISNMQKALAEYQPLLEEMTKNAIEMTEQIALETIQVEKASALVRKDEKIASEQAVVAQVLKSECEAELAQAIPILEDAISALNTLKPSDITLVKSMKNPPDAIKLVMASVCVIKDVKPDRIPDPSTGRKTIDYWGPSKRILGDMNFLQTLKDFDKDHIKPEIMVKIRKEYLPHKDFKPHVVAKASSAAEGLCKWIIAMDMYDRVAKEVAPKKEKLNKAEREYAETMLILNEKKEEVVRIEVKLAQLKALLTEATKKQLKLQVEVDLCNKKLNSAQKLIGSLSGERQRWTEASENLQKHYDVLAGDVLVSSAFVAYLPSLNNADRNIILTKWRDYIKDNSIPCTDNYEFGAVLSGEVEMEHWTEFSLPSDSFFIENGIIFNNSKYFRLLLDPHGKALEWITNFEDGNNMIITKFTFGDWLQDLKYCIINGKHILIKDTKGYIPPCLNYLVYGQSFVKENGDLFITIDGEDLRMHENFKIYILCCKPNVSYSAEQKSRLTLINFSLTSSALKEDVLRIVVEIEKPEIRKLSKELVQKNKEIKAELKELEVKILNTLCESQADILEDEESILILDETKELTKIALEKKAQTIKIAEAIESFKEKYITVAEHVAGLFFCIDNLQKLHHLYQFSLKWFKNTYFMSILNAGKSRDLKIRCQNLCDTFTYDLYKSVSKGLFEKDKTLFTFWLAIEMAASKNLITKEEIMMFFNVDQFKVAIDKNSKPEWVSDEQWANLHKIEQLDVFKGILKHFREDANWQIYLETSYSQIPHKMYKNFAKLILIQALKPNELYAELIYFIKEILGQKFLMPMFFNIQEVYNESYSLSPVLFISTPGLNVLNILYNFANTKQVLHKFHHLSLDNCNLEQGEKLIMQGKKEGCWILLQNCQYTKEWLYRLEQNLQNMDYDNTNENFRLFLTIDEVHEIPLELLQNSIKIIDESPGSLRESLLKIYEKPPIMIDDFFYGCPGQQEVFSKLLYSLCHFHFLIQKRQKFSNWNIQYKFDDSNLMLSLEFLRKIVNEQSCLFEKIYYLIGECNYNSYLHNECEKSFIIEMLKDCINPKMFEKYSGLFNNVKQYELPTKNDKRDYLNHIYNLPEQEPPEVLYLTESEMLEYNINRTKSFLTLGSKFVETKEGCVLSKNEFKILCIIDDLLNIFPETVKNNECNIEFILTEIRLYNSLLRTIKKSLRNLKAAFGGDCSFDTDLIDMTSSLSQNQIPKIWLKYCFPTLTNLSKFSENVCYNMNQQTADELFAMGSPEVSMGKSECRFS
ncbi:unnamed protein product [Ceutorhynchus assimilis]|uniref:Uncharacterized protein n=1 Tax=Ceutorhynchus assimilis TaxID=467358 RepID=A0A9N9N036_9CUCU|nr:unnamed protein product [Ceutorhynchus assimilis]